MNLGRLPFLKRLIAAIASGKSLVVAATFAFVLLALLDPGFMEGWETKTIDWRFLVRGPQSAGDAMVIVMIDERSIQEGGRWPWPRETMARLLTQISAGAPRVVAFDIIFSEHETVAIPSDSSDPAGEATLSAGERQFQAALKSAGNVVLGVGMEVPTDYQSDAQVLPNIPLGHLGNLSFSRITPGAGGAVEAIGALAPLAPFAEAAAALGHVYILPDRDGVLRREFLWLSYQGDYYPPISLQTARLYLGLASQSMTLRLGEGIRLGGFTVPTDEFGRMMINYRGREGTFPQYPAIDVLRGVVPASVFEDKAVFIGINAIGLGEMKATPLSHGMPGVEKNANATAGMIDRQFLYRAGWMKVVDAGWILVLGVILSLGLPRLRAVGGGALATALMMIHIALVTGVFIRWGVWFHLVYPAGSIAVSYVGFTAFEYFIEEKKARQIRAMFASYVTPRVLAEMIRNQELTQLGGTMQEMTVLFSDVRGFTTYCTQYPPQQVVALLNEYLAAMTDVIFHWEGTLDKFVGDSIMVFWGAPLPQPDHAQRAVGCALAMRKRLSELQQKWRSEGKAPFDIGIGISTGEMIVGNIGAEGKKMDYTVIGDTVNLAARVEGLTRKYPYPIIITATTYRQLEQQVGIHEIDEVKVKGREQEAGVVIYGVESV